MPHLFGLWLLMMVSMRTSPSTGVPLPSGSDGWPTAVVCARVLHTTSPLIMTRFAVMHWAKLRGRNCARLHRGAQSAPCTVLLLKLHPTGHELQ